MSAMISKTLLTLFCLCMAVGAFDHFCGNRWKLGERFLAGLKAFESLFLAMAGILVLVPMIRTFLCPFIASVFSFLGSDPGTFAGILLANDMGAYPLAQALTLNADAGDFGGMLLGSILGVNFVFTLPAALLMIRKEDQKHLFKGLLFGFIMVPSGAFLGGLSAGYPVIWLLHQLVPVLIISALSAVLLRFFPHKLARIMGFLGRTIEAIALAGIVAAITVRLTEINGGKWQYLDDVFEAIRVIGSIVIVLPGAYVCIELFSRLFKPFLNRAGGLLGVNESAVLGLFTTLANSIPTFGIIKDMDERGKTLNFAFLTGGAFLIGDHLAFCCAVAPDLVLPLFVTKFSTAFLAAVFYLFVEHLRAAAEKRKGSDHA